MNDNPCQVENCEQPPVVGVGPDNMQVCFDHYESYLSQTLAVIRAAKRAMSDAD